MMDLIGWESNKLICYIMKKLPFILMIVLMALCLQSKSSNQDLSEYPATISEFDWLLGSWQRMNDRPGRTTFEHWTKISNSEYHGLCYTLRKSDTIFKEHIKLLKRDGKWVFEVSGVNEDPTPFVLIKQSKKSFTCENKKNEFPKFIEYSLIDKKIQARIFGDGQEVLFTFQKLKP